MRITVGILIYVIIGIIIAYISRFIGSKIFKISDSYNFIRMKFKKNK